MTTDSNKRRAHRVAESTSRGMNNGEHLLNARTGTGDCAKAMSLTDAALELIRGRIIDMTLEPGSRIDERLLINQYKLGRTPAREAINRLAAEGFVRIVPQRGGTFVRKLDFEEVLEVVVAHEVAESMVGQLCRFEDPALVQDLIAINTKLEVDWLDPSNYTRVTELNLQFHVRLGRAINNSLMYDFVLLTHRHMRRLSTYALEHMARPNPTGTKRYYDEHYQQHKVIIEAVRERKREALIDLLTTHSKRLRLWLEWRLASTRIEPLRHNLVGIGSLLEDQEAPAG